SNTAVGHSALFNNTGSDNTAVGVNAGLNLTAGNGNVCIGQGVGGANGESGVTRIRNIGSTPIIDGTSVVVYGTGGLGDGGSRLYLIFAAVQAGHQTYGQGERS